MLTVFSVRFFAVLKLVLVCLAGVWLARSGVLHGDFRRSLSQMILRLMLPCLLLSKLSASVNPANLARWLVLPVSALLFVGLGFVVGALVIHIVRPPERLHRVVMAATAFGNSGYIPYPLVAAIAASAPIFAADPTANQRGIAYVSLYLVCMSPCLWAIGFPYLAHKPWRELRWNQILSPPILSAAAGITIGMVPVLRDLLVPAEAPLRVVLATADLIGDGVIPCSLLVLGANLAETPQGQAPLPIRVHLGVTWGRLVLMPLLGCIYVLAVVRLGVVPKDDPMLLLVLMLEAAVPSATNLIVMCQVHERGDETAMSRVLVFNYVAAVLTLTVFVALFLWLIASL